MPPVSVSKLLQSIATAPNPDQALLDHAFAGLTPEQQTQCEKQGWKVYRGKVREMLSRGDEVLMVHSDRLSAFDRYVALVPYKGMILTSITQFWLEKARSVAPTHLI